MREVDLEGRASTPPSGGRPRRHAGGGRPPGWRRWLAIGLLGAVAAVVVLAVPLTALGRSLGALPAAAAEPTDTMIYGQGDQLIADLHPSGSSRIPVPYSQIAPVMRHAVVAIEDHSFWTAPSFDIARIIQAGIFDVIHHSAAQGASTIPEQLAKILYLHDNKSIIYKVKEILYGQELSSKLSRQQILDQYLNDVYFGDGATGVQAAAEIYFGVPASKLSPAQATLLAGLLPAPSYLNPFSNMSGARDRQAVVLAAMVKYGQMNQKEAAQIRSTAPQLASGQAISVNNAPYFVGQVESWLSSHYGPNYRSMGLNVYTSLNVGLNNQAQQMVTSTIQNDSAMHMTDGALVAEDPKTGDVIAWVGGAGSNVPGGQIDMVDQPRQPGSTFKLFNYSTAIAERKVTMTTPVRDSPLTLPTGGPGGGPYVVHDYEGTYAGVVPIQVALGNSLNVPAVRVELKTGVAQVVATARNMGVTTLNNSASSYGPSLTLGAYPVPLWEMTQAGSVFATLGTLHPLHYVLRVTDGQGNTLYTAPSTSRQVLSPQVSYIMDTMLSRNSNRLIAFGAYTPLVLPGIPAAVKTGTSNNYLDNLAVGWTPNLVVGDWVGNANDSPMYGGGLNGISGSASLWHEFMMAALANQPKDWYQTPSGLVTKTVNGQTAYFLPGTGPTYNVLGGGSTAPTPTPTPSLTPTPTPTPSPTPTPTPSASPPPSPSPSPPGPPTPPG